MPHPTCCTQCNALAKWSILTYPTLFYIIPFIAECMVGLLWWGLTYLHGLGYDSTHINLQMAHVDNTVSGIYNHALYLPERTKMLQDWADYLDEL